MRLSRLALLPVLAAILAAGCAPEPLPPLMPPPSQKPSAAVAAPVDPFPSSPELIALRDPRFSGRELHARRLLVTEVQGLEAVFGVTPAGSPDRPKLMVRLGHEYAELGYRAQQDARAAQAAFEASGDVGKKNEAAKADVIRKAAFAASAKYYAVLSKAQPQGCAGFGGCADESTYFAALALERGGGMEYAQSAYYELVRGWRESRWIPYAFLAFGEQFLDEGRQDSLLTRDVCGR